MKKFTKLIITLTLLSITAQAQTLKDAVTKETPIVSQKPFYQGKIVTILQAKSYTYLEIKESTNLTFWIAINAVDAKVGDFVRFQKELVTQNFKSTILNRTFKELMFASHLQYRKIVLKKD